MTMTIQGLITDEAVVALYKELHAQRSIWLNMCQQICNMYQGDVAAPLSHLPQAEQSAAINLLGPALDEISMRSGSISPNIKFPSVRPGVDLHDFRARDRRLATMEWMKANHISQMRRLRFRHLFAYGASPVMISPVGTNNLDRREIPHWREYSPLNSFSPAMSSKLDMEPPFSINYSQQTLRWLSKRYPDQAERIYKGKIDSTKGPDPLMMFDILEYNDDFETVCILVGKNRDPRGWHGDYQVGAGFTPCERLEWWPNRAGLPLTVVPGRITLGRLQGIFDQLIPKFARASKLQAMQDVAITRSVFPETWAVAHPGDPQDPDIIVKANGPLGTVGVLAHGTIMPTSLAPPQAIDMALDRLERTQRVENRIPSDWGGESPTNVRTARRGNDVDDSTVSMPIQEQQELMAISHEAEIRRAIAVKKGWWGSKATYFYVPLNGKSDAPFTDYVPNEIFDTDNVQVRYPLPGVDSQGLVIELSQRVGSDEMSVEEMQELDPMIEDAELTRKRLVVGNLRRAILASLDAQVQQGGMDAQTIARITKLTVASDEEIEEVVDKVHKEMQAEQAAAAAAAPTPADPNAQPGMGPGAMPPGGPPAIPAVTQSQPSNANLAGLLGALRAPAGG